MKKHHYVPEFLLRQWHSAPDGRLTRFGWEHRSFLDRRRSASMCARVAGLYRLHGPAPEFIEENFLGRVDNDAALVHQQFLAMNKKRLSTDERIAWSRFLISLMRRNPEFVARLRREASVHFDEAVSEFSSDFSDRADEMSEYLKGPRGVAQRKNLGLSSVFVDLVNSDRINPIIVNAQWKIRKVACPDYDLLIGDRPVIHVGQLSGGFLLALLLSPRHAFFAFDKPEYGEKIDAESPKEIIRKLNVDSVDAARFQIFATSSSQGEFVRKRLRVP